MEETEKRTPVPPREVANALCMACRRFIKLDPEQERDECPHCRKALDVTEAIRYYDCLLRLEQEKIEKVANSMSFWHYHTTKLKYLWDYWLPYQAICLPVIAVGMFAFQFVREVYEFPPFTILFAIAVLGELLCLFCLVPSVFSGGLREEVARYELFGSFLAFEPITISTMTALFAFGLAGIVGLAGYGEIASPQPSAQPAKTARVTTSRDAATTKTPHEDILAKKAQESAGKEFLEKILDNARVYSVSQQVIRGDWGNGSERKQRLTAAGYDYDEVQTEVNRILDDSSSTISVGIDQLARDVIAGKYGNGDARKQALGSNYDTIQKRVNELLSGSEFSDGES